jgi:hypothetical protein
MMRDFQIVPGDICGDATGLRVMVEDVDVYDYVHFTVIDGDDPEEIDPEAGEMSHIAFVHRFTKQGNIFARRTAA